MKPTTYHAQELKEMAEEYNRWLEDSGKHKNRFYPFLKGMSSVFDIFGTGNYGISDCDNPLYARKDLTPEQKDAIALASDRQRAMKTLEDLL